MLPARRRARGHRRPRSGRGRRPGAAAAPRPGQAPLDAVGRGPLPLAARPARPGRPACWPPPRPTTDVAWVVTREEVVDEGWFGPEGQRRGHAGAWATSPWWPATTCPSTIPLDTGPFSLVGRHGSLTPAEMRVPLLGRGILNRPHPPTSRSPPMSDPASPDNLEQVQRGELVDRGSAGRRGRGSARVGAGAGQGDADRLDDQAAARGGAGDRARRAGPRPAAARSTTRR